jgi:hypothetical protein
VARLNRINRQNPTGHDVPHALLGDLHRFHVVHFPC